MTLKLVRCVVEGVCEVKDNRPVMMLVRPETRWFENSDTKAAVQEFWRRRGQETKDQGARERLVRTSNLTTAPKYRPCPDGCGLTLLWSNPGHHPTADDLEPDALTPDPVEPPSLRDAVSQAQVLWTRDMLAQFPRKSKEQICRENGGIAWAQREHFAKTPLSGLPERSTKKARDQAKAMAKKSPVKKPAKARQS